MKIEKYLIRFAQRFTCKCGKSFSTLRQLLSHQKLFCKGK